MYETKKNIETEQLRHQLKILQIEKDALPQQSQHEQLHSEIQLLKQLNN